MLKLKPKSEYWGNADALRLLKGFPFNKELVCETQVAYVFRLSSKLHQTLGMYQVGTYANRSFITKAHGPITSTYIEFSEGDKFLVLFKQRFYSECQQC
jgi:hypothetical protein